MPGTRASRPSRPPSPGPANRVAATPAIADRPRLAPALRQEQLALLGALLALAAVGWVVTDQRMDDMGPGPMLDLGGLGFYVTVWVVMMAAMMFPSVAPSVLLYHRLRG